MCLRWLEARPRSRFELAASMGRRGVATEVAEQVLDRLAAVGLVDDAAFADAWVQGRHAGKGLARRALAYELRQKGVDADTSAQALAELSPEQEEDAAFELARKRVELLSRRDLDPTAITTRVAGLLARKGYPSGLAYRAVRAALAELSAH